MATSEQRPEEITVLIGLKVRGYESPRCFLVGRVMEGLRRVGVDCHEAWGIKDPAPVIAMLTEERDAAMLELRRLRGKASVE